MPPRGHTRFVFQRFSAPDVATRRQLIGQGFTPRELSAGVHSGRLLRLRRGYYARPDLNLDVQRAVRVGGLLTCVSAASQLGIWVPPGHATHVRLRHEASRLRAPDDRFTRLTTDNRDGSVLHWHPLIEPSEASMSSVGVVDALADVVRCQPKSLAIAAMDSALNCGIIDGDGLARLFAALPHRYRNYLAETDGRSMSGIESLYRLMIVRAGLQWRTQVAFEGVGIVDFVVEERLVVEVDGRRWHASMVQSTRDYDRDMALAAAGYQVLRVNYRQLMFEPESVLAATLGALRGRAAH